ncbi:Fanconi anemia group D2 protein isoform X2 [Periplaneta americana]|uniref:Fanconi anemia group D2 protein isoform X2 n=1 Tax=Periplaneta americana TaxID=6978 RepID=UPI0037E91208
MYKRKSRTPKIGLSPARLVTSTPVSEAAAIENIPFELPTTSQKRKEVDTEKNNASVKRHRPCVSRSYFEEVVTNSGYVFQDGDTTNELSRDQAIFARDVTYYLKKNPLYPKNVENFIEDFEKYCNENSNFKKVLTHTKTSADCKDARGNMQESLVRLLLSIDCLQPRLSEFLLEKVGEFAMTGDEDPDSTTDTPWIRIILRQMRQLEHIVDGKTLNGHLFEVLDAAPLAVQREIIFCLPDIITDEQHNEAALKLSNLLKTDFKLTPAIMECLENLCFESTLRIEVCSLMVKYLNTAPPEFLPVIISFLLSSGQPLENLTEVVAGLRQNLDLNPSGGIDSSNQILIISTLEKGALRYPKVAEVWLKAILNSHSSSGVNPLDIAVLLLLHSSTKNRKKQVQSVLRNRIKGGIITEAVVEKTFTTLLAAVKTYVKTAIAMATVLLRSPEPAVSYLGRVWFKQMLVHLEHYERRDVIQELLLLIGTGGISLSNLALAVMAGVESCHFLQHIFVLMGLLDNLQDMDLIQVGQVMDLLCSIVYGDGADSTHQDEIHMLIRKHLSSSNVTLKQKGVVGAVMALKHLAISDSESLCDGRSTPSSVDSHLSGRAGRAKELLELVMESVQNHEVCVGLLFDQLAVAVCSCSNLDGSFLKWIAEKTADKFQDYYVKEYLDVSRNGCPQFSLELLEDDYEDVICVDIEGVLKLEKSESKGDEQKQPLSVMIPQFRLLRSLQFRISNSLESVDGLLGCFVAMPKDLNDLIDDFPRLNHEEQILVLDSLFYCINWFRELVNAFSLLRDQEMQVKVLRRIENIIDLQELLAKGLGYAKSLEYKPPRCHFYADVKSPLQDKPKKPSSTEKKKAKGGGRGKKKGAANTTAADENAAMPGEPKNTATGEVDLSLYKGFFRELDMEVFVSLSKNFVTDKKNAEDGEPVLYPKGLLFLLNDYVTKLDHCLPSTVKRISSLATTNQATLVGFANLDRIASPVIARRAMKLLTYILKKLELTGQYCQELLELNDGIHDGPEMFKEGSAEVKLCFGMLLQAVASTLGWTGFHSNTYSSLLKDCLCAIASRQNKEATNTTSVKELVHVSCEYFLGYATRTLHLTAAENLMRVMQILSNFAPAEAEPRRKLVEICRGFLSRQWHTLDGLPESGGVYNCHLEALVKTYLTSVDDKLSVVGSTSKWVEEEVKNLQNKDSTLTTFPTITKLNFPILYRNLWNALRIGAQQALESSSNNAAKFKVWHSVCSTMATLTSIIREHDHHANRLAYIKHSQSILQLFLSHGMPVMETLLKTKCENVTSMLKTLQVTTRYLHALCISTKIEKSAGLTSYVPLVRKTLETLVFKVKGMLVANNSSDAFWMGNLKNKTVQGDEILTQDTATEHSEGEDEGEVMPEDENSDVDLDNINNSDQESSVSEVF